MADINSKVLIIESVAVAIAMYCLIRFYIQVRMIPRYCALPSVPGIWKILCIKLVIFLFFWQSVCYSFRYCILL